MLGPPKPCRLDEAIAVSLEDLVPANHFYRHLEVKLDLGFVRKWTREPYAERDGPRIDPVVYFKLQLIMVCDDIRIDRRPGRGREDARGGLVRFGGATSGSRCQAALLL